MHNWLALNSSGTQYSRFLLWIRLILLLAVLFILLTSAKLDLFELSLPNDTLWLTCSLVLMPINLLLECKKLGAIMPAFNTRSFSSLSTMFMASAYAVIMPISLAQILVIKSKESLRLREITKAVLISRMAQFPPSLLFGLISFLILGPHFLDTILEKSISLPDWLTPVSLLILIVGMGWVSVSQRWIAYRNVFIYAHLRYLIFICQFVLIFKSYLPDLPIHLLLMGSSVVLLMKSLMPTFNFLMDLGLRELAAVLIFVSFGCEQSVVLQASFSIWIVNFLLPSAIGSVLLLIHHFKSKF